MLLHDNINTGNITKKRINDEEFKGKANLSRVCSYVWHWHCRRRSNRWMALRRWLPVWRQATPTCHSQMSASGRWLSTWSSLNICFSISKPDSVRRMERKIWSSKERVTHQKCIFAEFFLLYMHVSILKWSTCLEPSSVATRNSELVAPFGITHVWHKSVVECIPWEKETVINSNATEKLVRNEHNLEHRIGGKKIYS